MAEVEDAIVEEIVEQIVSLNIPEQQTEREEEEIVNLHIPEQQIERKEEEGQAKNTHLLSAGRLGLCDLPFCITCPTYLKAEEYDSGQLRSNTLHEIVNRSATNFSLWRPRIPVMNSHSRHIIMFSSFHTVVGIMAIIMDALFILVIYSDMHRKCIGVNWNMARLHIIWRFLSDLVFLFHSLLGYKLAYICFEPRPIGAGYLVDDPTKIFLHYAPRAWVLDTLAMLPFPYIFFIIPPTEIVSTFGLGDQPFYPLLPTMMIMQIMIRMIKFSPKKLFNIIIMKRVMWRKGGMWIVYAKNIFLLVLIGHVVGCFGYLAAFEMVYKCLKHACKNSGLTDCEGITNCEIGAHHEAHKWYRNAAASACLNSTSGAFGVGIFTDVIPLVGYDSIRKYLFALLWGITQIFNISVKTPSISNSQEVIFVLANRVLGLSIFAILIGNVQSIVQGVGKRKIEMLLRYNEVKQWSRHRRLPEKLRRRILYAEIHSWILTRGVKPEKLTKSMPEDIQRDLTRHQFFSIIKKVPLLAIMDKPILDAICMKLKWKMYLKNSTIMHPGELTSMIIFVSHGKLEITDNRGIIVHIYDGNACGEELLLWCLQRSFLHSNSSDSKKLWLPEENFLSTKKINCLTDVEAFALEANEVEEILARFQKFLHTPRIEEAVRRYESLGESVSNQGDSGSNQTEPQSVAAAPQEN